MTGGASKTPFVKTVMNNLKDFTATSKFKTGKREGGTHVQQRQQRHTRTLSRSASQLRKSASTGCGARRGCSRSGFG
jgi:hypothetical protein